MAKRFLSRDDKKAARDNAEKHFNGGKKKKAAEEPKQRVLQDLTKENGPKPRDFLHHFTTAKGFKDKLETAQGHYRNALKQAKEAGIDPAVITSTMKWQKKDPLEVQTYFKQLRATFEAAHVEVQLEIFSESSISRPAQIYDDGYKAGKAGKSSTDNPHAENTPAGQTWLQGWHAGQAENMAGIGKTPESKADETPATH